MTRKYALSARAMHWIVAAGFIFMWACGYAMTTLVEDDSPLEDFLFGLHISIGVTLLVLMVARVAIRLWNRPPPLPNRIGPFEQDAAHVGHMALYALPFLVIAFGWSSVDFGGDAVAWFGIALPVLLPESETLGDLTEELHMWLAYAMLAMAAGHVLAALKHQWIDGVDIIGRMTIQRRE